MLATENLRLSNKRTQAEKVSQTFSLRRGLGELTDVYEIVWEKLQELK
ncbi:phosphoribosylaminoimidazolesuccinocarboxamide synthase [Streptococcus oralis]